MVVHVVGEKAFKPQDVGAQQGGPVPVQDEHVQLENACKARFARFLWLHRRREGAEVVESGERGEHAAIIARPMGGYGRGSFFFFWYDEGR